MSETARSTCSLLSWVKVRSVVFSGYSHWNILRGISGQDIWNWDHRRTYMCTRWWTFQGQKQHSQILHCCHSSRCVLLFLWEIDTEIFTDGFRDKIFDTKIVAALVHALDDTSFDLRTSAVKIFTAVTAQGALSCFHGILTPKYSQRGFGRRYLTMRLLPHLHMHSAIKAGGPSDIVQSWFSLLSLLKVPSIFFVWSAYRNIGRWFLGQDIWHWDHRHTRTCTRWYGSLCQKQHSWFLHCCHSSRSASFFSWDIDTKIFPEAFWDKIFDTDIIAALRRGLGDTDPYVRSSAVNFFTAATAQGSLHFFCVICIPTYSQMVFGTRYLTLTPLLYLYEH